MEEREAPSHVVSIKLAYQKSLYLLGATQRESNKHTGTSEEAERKKEQVPA